MGSSGYGDGGSSSDGFIVFTAMTAVTVITEGRDAIGRDDTSSKGQ